MHVEYRSHVKPGLSTNQNIVYLAILMAYFESDFESESIAHNTYIMYACKVGSGDLHVT